ncbi:hypothetical protein HAZT_HAZT010288 [Hyalella azteca]|uniref:Pentraxin (PTX) domain-containing protein n=1 Tax=Hyalella azteca TaxID=294128 RepID=A0A6A0HBN7_HYAAZ|nr:hypothetical protein HAZT_HAZT010288 [Hyalella azteca]
MVNVWDYPLKPSEIKGIANCSADVQGNFVSWSRGFILTNASSFDVSLTSLCQHVVATTYMWFPHVTDKQAFYICDALGTHLPLPMTGGESYELHRVSRASWGSDKFYYGFISPLRDELKENEYRRNFDGQIQPYHTIIWTPDEPNGDVYENCVYVSEYGFYDVECTADHCATCRFLEPRVFTLRGTCERELRNTFFLAQQGVGSLEFTGYGSYHIRDHNHTWLWSDGDHNIAYMEPHEFNFPMGRRAWTLTGEHPVCGQKEGARELSLSVCSEGEFTCDDARCVPLETRCDLKFDCQDQSDEQLCSVVSIPAVRWTNTPTPCVHTCGEMDEQPQHLVSIPEVRWTNSPDTLCPYSR